MKDITNRARAEHNNEVVGADHDREDRERLGAGPFKILASLLEGYTCAALSPLERRWVDAGVRSRGEQNRCYILPLQVLGQSAPNLGIRAR